MYKDFVYKAIYSQGSMEMYWNVLECIEMYWNIFIELKCIGIVLNFHGCIELYWNCIELYCIQ